MEENEKEYFVVANSFAAPIVSDTSTSYVKGVSPDDALSGFVESYKHVCGLYSANLYKSADDYHRGEKPLAKFRHSKCIEIEKVI